MDSTPSVPESTRWIVKADFRTFRYVLLGLLVYIPIFFVVSVLWVFATGTGGPIGPAPPGQGVLTWIAMTPFFWWAHRQLRVPAPPGSRPRPVRFALVGIALAIAVVTLFAALL
jgi:hypothetical protein